MRIAVENLWGRDKDRKIVGGRLSTPEELSAFLDQLNPELFCACIDLGHAEIVGENAARFIRTLGMPKLQALHVQDTDLKNDSHMLPGLGKHNWEEITQALAESGYQGDLTLEVFAYLRSFPVYALADALKLACTVGRGLIADIDKYRA
ncbi:MAG: sugar phosphate isomerase/epimerase [Clostridia bacterium]|nr:sugar phosphate isomerase/epimerase [Clostridia bacterium]